MPRGTSSVRVDATANAKAPLALTEAVELKVGNVK